MTDFTQVDVETLLPHTQPMVLLDRLVRYSETGLTAAVGIREDTMFYDANIQGVGAWVGIEYMAQTIAAFAGVCAKQQGKPIKIGFLLGSRKLALHEKILKLGKEYLVSIEELFRDESGLASFECVIESNGVKCVTAKVNVFETDEESHE